MIAPTGTGRKNFSLPGKSVRSVSTRKLKVTGGGTSTVFCA